MVKAVRISASAGLAHCSSNAHAAVSCIVRHYSKEIAIWCTWLQALLLSAFGGEASLQHMLQLPPVVEWFGVPLLFF
jgi:hypothetical protein